jgi:glycosyltransferase involved in cell wall biosynthesis
VLNILWVNHRDPKHPFAGGAEVRIHEIGKRLVQNGHSVSLICERWPGSKNIEFIDGIEVRRVGSKYNIHLKVPFLIHKIGNYDVVIDDIAHAIPWESRFFTNKSVIGQVHHVHQEMLELELNPLLAKIIALSERTVRSYKLIITVCESTKNALIGLGVSRKTIKVIPNGVDTDFYKPGVKSASPTILWVGRVKRYKRVDHVLLAFSLIEKQLPNANLIIVGSGDYNYIEALKNIAKKLGLSNVVFTGLVDENKKAMLMASSWVTVSSSLVEGWGLTITESAACGTPAVAYDVDGLRDSIRNNETGLLVIDGNVKALAQAILRVLQDEVLRVTLGTNALRWATELSWDKVAKDFIAFLELNNNTCSI